jgi:biopolymer transport protein ExbD
MAEIIDPGGGENKGGKKRAKKGHVHLDMTPMVDLAFLLLTFFILATSLNKPKALEIIYPKEVKEDDKKTKLQDDLATTLLIGEGDEDLYYYFGKFKPDTTELTPTDFSKDGFRKVLLERNKSINESVKMLKERFSRKEISDSTYKQQYSRLVNDSLAPFVIVKTIEDSKWRNVVNAIDELNITNVKKRAIIDMADSEAIAVRQRSAERKKQ